MTDPAQNYLFNTVWVAVAQAENLMVAAICFRGEPNEQGEVEIGYETFAPFLNRGFITESIAALSHWALAQPKTRAVLAVTAADNAASHRALPKNDFVPESQADNEVRLLLLYATGFSSVTIA
ncbi:GNAT family N-acetyltransferase [Hymenobacter saemangeumensis]|uniref:GNAT family N-acetyltransferase n=1 Tax=Hymenobacter saemangeumensis TaxID=1084522 RepID=UPI0031EC1FD8